MNIGIRKLNFITKIGRIEHGSCEVEGEKSHYITHHIATSDIVVSTDSEPGFNLESKTKMFVTV